MAKFQFGGKTASSKAGGRFNSGLQSGTAKNGSRYTKSYGITNSGTKWNNVSFHNKVKIKNGKNAGQTRTVIKTIHSTQRFQSSKRR